MCTFLFSHHSLSPPLNGKQERTAAEGPARHVARAHEHWVWDARFNPQHDELVLSSASDSLVRLWWAPGMALAHVDREGAADVAAPVTACASFDEHDDSVYRVAWSAADTWTWATVSHSGQCVFGVVPASVADELLAQE